MDIERTEDVIYRLITDLNLQVELASRAHTSTATIVINADVEVQDFVGRRRADHAIAPRGRKNYLFRI